MDWPGAEEVFSMNAREEYFGGGELSRASTSSFAGPTEDRQRRGTTIDRLPPHSLEAEQGVIGCCMVDPGTALQLAIEHFGEAEVFYDLRHQLIFKGLVDLHLGGKTPDLIVLQQWLKDRNELEAVGGIMYLTALVDAVVSAANVEHYLEILWEKYLARKTIQLGVGMVSQVYERNGVSEGLLAGLDRQFEGFKALSSRRLGITPQDLKRPGEFAEEYHAKWFKESAQEEGWTLPFKFPLNVRTHEMTILTGDSGSGKSSFLGHLSVDLMKQGVKVCMASMEVPSPISLWIMSRQVLGRGPHMTQTVENERQAAAALAWLNARMWIYDFLGITDWRTLLDIFRYAREKEGVGVFVLDSVMRIGIAEDDLTQQAMAAAEFANFTVKTGAHLLIVNHQNKGDGKVKQRVSGSKKWTDNANNLTELQRNESKWEKINELEEQARLYPSQRQELEKKKEELRFLWDSRFVLHKQRYPGAPQNGAKHLFFDRESLQLRDRLEDRVVNYLLA